MSSAVILVAVVIALALVLVLLVLIGVVRPRSRWWQAWQNRAHSQRPGPGGPRFP